MNRYFTYFILLGSISTLSFYGMQDAIGVMYSSPLEQQNFGSFFLQMSMIVIAIGMFFQWIVPLKMSMIKIDIYGPGLVMLSAVIVGHIYSHNLKTDEFLYYFILTHLITMYVALSAGRQLIALIKKGAINVHGAAICVIGLVLGSAITYSLHFFVTGQFLLVGIWHIYLALLLSNLAIFFSGHLFNTDQLSRPA
ncbi:MAG: hypothetical protein RIF33_26240 [Cyclobacteriaceae bacterium]